MGRRTPILHGAPAQLICDFYIRYVANHFPNNKHVRRVVPWIGFIVKAIERGAGTDWWIHGRQLDFRCGGRKFRLKYAHPHRIGGKGGMVIVEIVGRKAGKTLVTIRDVTDAERFYNEAPTIFQKMRRRAVATKPGRTPAI